MTELGQTNSKNAYLMHAEDPEVHDSWCLTSQETFDGVLEALTAGHNRGKQPDEEQQQLQLCLQMIQVTGDFANAWNWHFSGVQDHIQGETSLCRCVLCSACSLAAMKGWKMLRS